MANIPFDQVFAEAMADPETHAHYDAMAPAFAIADAIIKLRTARRLTQAQLADAMGAKQPFVALLESGHHVPSMNTILRVARATGSEFKFELKPERELEDV